MNKFDDKDMDVKARDARYVEFCGLKSLPFMDETQVKRYRKLSTLRVRDNKYAFENSSK